MPITNPQPTSEERCEHCGSTADKNCGGAKMVKLVHLLQSCKGPAPIPDFRPCPGCPACSPKPIPELTAERRVEIDKAIERSFHGVQPSEDQKWEEEYDKLAETDESDGGFIAYNDEYAFKSNAALKAFISRLVKEARQDGFDDGYAHANKSLGAVVRDRMAEADKDGFTRGVRAAMEAVKHEVCEEDGCLCRELALSALKNLLGEKP